jgi:hypothetical protein
VAARVHKHVVLNVGVDPALDRVEDHHLGQYPIVTPVRRSWKQIEPMDYLYLGSIFRGLLIHWGDNRIFPHHHPGAPRPCDRVAPHGHVRA